MPTETMDALAGETRRQFFRRCPVALGGLALANLLAGDGLAAASARPSGGDGLNGLHHVPKVKRVIYLFMAGGPSQFELFESKPELQKLHDQPIPESFVKGRRFAFMDTFSKERPKLLGTKRKFKPVGDAGLQVSELLPHFRHIANEVAFVRTVGTDIFNHAPAKLFVNTGSAQAGRPSMGSWLSYGIGSESRDLPAFVVLQSGGRGPRGGAPLWGSGFLPTAHQGVPFRSLGDPIVSLSSPPGIDRAIQGDTVEAVADLNRMRQSATGDAEITTRIKAYEMAYRMQSSAPELIDLGRETRETLDLYGATPGKASFANNCLLARRLVERGVRFVQLYHTDWDHHGDTVNHLGAPLEKVCGGHAGHLGRRVRAHPHGRGPRAGGPQPPYRRVPHVVRGGRGETGHRAWPDGRVRVWSSLRQGPCPRCAGNCVAPLRHRPQETHLPVPGA